MQRPTLLWLVGAAVALISGPATAQPPEWEPGSPADPVIAQWQQAGAIFGWITIEPKGDWRFHREKPSAEGIPAFQFSGRFPAGKVKTLASPDVPFSLWLGGSTKDADLEDLAGLKQLQALNFADTSTYGVTDAGLKALPRLKALRTLTILSSGGGVSDVGLNELGGMTQLQKLDLPGRVTDAAIDELRKALPQARITPGRPPFTM